jgi:flagellar hook-length control protein FliK
MDHLGSTDVSVKLHGRHVSTSFYFENDETYALVQAHASILEERLAAKGYNCDVKVINESKKVNFVDDFLKKDQPSTGLVHRYSFDMKA